MPHALAGSSPRLVGRGLPELLSENSPSQAALLNASNEVHYGVPMSEPDLSSFIWSVADLLRGDYKQSEYGKVILPFTVRHGVRGNRGGPDMRNCYSLMRTISQ